MKKLGKLKLNYLAQNELNEQEMNVLRGGAGDCFCACAYPTTGSTSPTNDAANNADDLKSPGYANYTGTGGSTNLHQFCDDGIWGFNTNFSCIDATNCNNAPNKC